ncbi:hypothetical protein ACFL1H_05280 [Nanoarchaeota archaeon]
MRDYIDDKMDKYSDVLTNELAKAGLLLGVGLGFCSGLEYEGINYWQNMISAIPLEAIKTAGGFWLMGTIMKPLYRWSHRPMYEDKYCCKENSNFVE